MRILGWILIALAGLVLALDALGWPVGEPPAPVYPLSALDALWTRLGPASLAWSQSMIEQHVSPGLWQRAIVPVLRLPGVVVFALPGLLLLALADLGNRYGFGGVSEGTAAARRRHRRQGGLRD